VYLAQCVSFKGCLIR